jgi:hypothetical protein
MEMRGGVAPAKAAGEQGEVRGAFLPVRQIGVVGEGWRAVGGFRRQGDPELHGMQAAAGGDGIFGVRNAVAGSHEVHFAGADDLVVAQAVVVQRFALYHPGEGLQADVRMCAHMHAAIRRKIHGAEMVKKAPGTHHALLACGQGTQHAHAIAQIGAAGGDAFHRAHGGVSRLAVIGLIVAQCGPSFQRFAQGLPEGAEGVLPAKRQIRLVGRQHLRRRAGTIASLRPSWWKLAHASGRMAWVSYRRGSVDMKFREMAVISQAVGRKDFAAVQRLCQEALLREPGDWFALGMLAQSYANAKQYDKAMPLAVRMLEIRPDDFMALQIAAFAARERADRTETYRYAQKLAGLDLAAIEKNEGRSLRLFKWLSWIPLFRNAYRNHTSQQAQQKASRVQWVRWAREYVSAVNTRPAAND